jgi:hypothetical protein
VLVGAWGFALFPLDETGVFLWIAVAITVGHILVALMHGPQAAFFSELFNTGVRYSGASLGYQLGAIIGGAFAPLIATGLLAASGTSLAISAYIVISCAITLTSVLLLLQESYQRDL